MKNDIQVTGKQVFNTLSIYYASHVQKKQNFDLGFLPVLISYSIQTFRPH